MNNRSLKANNKKFSKQKLSQGNYTKDMIEYSLVRRITQSNHVSLWQKYK